MPFPLIGLVQLAHYYVTCKILSKEPGELREGLARTTSHSQGIVIAAAIASASTWDSFHCITSNILTILSWMGCPSQQTYPRASLAPSTLQDSINVDEGTPSPLLSV